MTKPRAVPSTPNSKTTLWVLECGGIEIVFEILDHAVARISVDPQESVIISNAVETLSELFLRKPSGRVFRGKCLYCLLLVLDVSLDVPPRTPFRVDFLRCNGDEIVSEDIRNFVLLKHVIDGLDRIDTGEAEKVLDFW